MDERLSADDARILALESEAIAGHTLKLIVLEAGPEPLNLAALREAVDARLPADSRGRDRVEDGRDGPRWVADPDFDVAAHVVRVDGSAGADMAGALAAASRLMSEHLDHRRPLWRFDLVGPLADGREALVCRIHHAMADGVTCVRFLGEVLWDEAEAPVPARRSRAVEAARGRLREAIHLPGALGRELGHRASDTRFDRPIGAARELAIAGIDLAELKAIGASRPGHVTVNDVLLAGIAGGLRRWLAAAREHLPRMRAQVPVSLHHRDEGKAELGNRDSFLNVDLALAEADPLARLDSIAAQTGVRKTRGDAQELYDLFHALGCVPSLERAIERLAGGPREFSLSVSNVPGPRGRLSVAGRAVESLHSFAEPAQRHALRAAAISAGERLGIGLCTDPDAVPGAATLAAEIEGSLAELRVAAIG